MENNLPIISQPIDETLQIARKAMNNAAIDSIHFREVATSILAQRNPVNLKNVLECINRKKDFILYNDTRNYCIFLTDRLATISYVGGVETVADFIGQPGKFIEAIEMGVIVYKNFYEKKNIITL